MYDPLIKCISYFTISSSLVLNKMQRCWNKTRKFISSEMHANFRFARDNLLLTLICPLRKRPKANSSHLLKFVLKGTKWVQWVSEVKHTNRNSNHNLVDNFVLPLFVEFCLPIVRISNLPCMFSLYAVVIYFWKIIS